MNVHAECWALGKEIHWAQIREGVYRNFTFATLTLEFLEIMAQIRQFLKDGFLSL